MKERYQKLIDAANKAMLEKMHENDHKSGWANLRIESSCCYMRREYRELFREVYPADPIDDRIDYEKVRREAADVANYAAMIILKCDREIKKRSAVKYS